jgi:hypothetical protein
MTLIQDELIILTERIKESLNLPSLKFYYSTPYEFVTMMSKAKDDVKYPFIFVSSIGVRYEEKDLVVVPDIVIGTKSKAEWSALVRDERSMKPILIPILEELTRQIKSVSRRLSMNTYGSKTLHYFYGRSGLNGYEGTIFPDHIDAIQLQGYRFRITSQCK